MKTKLLLIALVAIVLLPCCVISVGSNIKYTHLPPEGRNIPIQSFTAIKANGVFNIILQQGINESVVVKDDYTSDLKVTNDGNTLIVMDSLSNHTSIEHKKTTIYITYKQLNSIETESIGEIKTLDTIKTVRFNFESDGVGENTLCLNADSVTASANGVGALNLSGKAHYANIEDNGVGKLKAKDFKVGILHASISGVGAGEVYAENEIYLQVSGVGGVKYYGPAKVMENESSGIGKVERGE